MTSTSTNPPRTPKSGNDANRIIAKAVSVTHTKGPDWARSLPVPDNAWRIYETVRSYIYEQDPSSVSVRITDAELAELTHRSVSAAKRARQAATRWGLLVEARRWTESYGRGTARTVRELSVLLDDVPDWYVGPTNCWEIKRALRANGGLGIEWSQVTARTDQGERETPGQIGGSHLLSVRANLLGTRSHLLSVRANVLDRTGGEQRKPAPQETPQEEVQEHQQQGAGDGGGEVIPKEEDEQPDEGDGAPEPVDSSSEHEDGTDPQDHARSLLRSLRLPRGKQFNVHAKAVSAVARAVHAGVPDSAIRTYLLDGTESARSPGAIVTMQCQNVDDLIAEHQEQERFANEGPGWSDASDSPQSPACRTCGAHEGAPSPQRVVKNTAPTGRAYVRCPDCHPSKQQSEPGNDESVADLANDAAAALGLPA